MTWSGNCITVAGTASNQNPTFSVNDTKLYVSAVTLSTKENIKLYQKLKTGFIRTINWNKYLAKTTNQAQKRHLDFLFEPSFQRVDRLFFCHLKIIMVEKVTSNIIFQPWKQKIIML